MDQLLTDIRACTLCMPNLPAGPNPVLAAHLQSKIAVVGQAPGRIVHETGIPWDDKSGERLRDWLGVTTGQFYDPELLALIPMGFCFPGTGKSGDLPPRPECAPTWHQQLFDQMKELKLILLIGSYAQSYYLPKEKKRTLTETVRSFREYLPEYLVLPHPSPRNNIWLKKNPWFAEELLPELRKRVAKVVDPPDRP